jgi:hypothetical protein
MRLSNPPFNGYSGGGGLRLLGANSRECVFAAPRLCESFASLLKPTIALGPGETNNVARTTQCPGIFIVLPVELIGSDVLSISIFDVRNLNKYKRRLLGVYCA